MPYATLVARFWLRVRGVSQSPCRRQSRDKRQGLWGRECIIWYQHFFLFLLLSGGRNVQYFENYRSLSAFKAS